MYEYEYTGSVPGSEIDIICVWESASRAEVESALRSEIMTPWFMGSKVITIYQVLAVLMTDVEAHSAHCRMANTAT